MCTCLCVHVCVHGISDLHLILGHICRYIRVQLLLVHRSKHKCTHTHKYSTCTHTHAHMHTRTHACTHTHTHTYNCMPTHKYVCTYAVPLSHAHTLQYTNCHAQQLLYCHSGVFSLGFGLIGVFITDWKGVKENGFFQGYNIVVAIVILLQVGGAGYILVGYNSLISSTRPQIHFQNMVD